MHYPLTQKSFSPATFVIKECTKSLSLKKLWSPRPRNRTMHQGWVLTFALLGIFFTLGNSPNALGSEDESAPRVTILDTQNIVQEKGPEKWHEFEFLVPQSGTANLRLSNGAKTEGGYLDHIVGVNINVCHETCTEIDSDESCDEGKNCNSEPVLPLYFFNDQLEIPMDLQAGINKLRFLMYAKPGKWLSLRIDAPIQTSPLIPASTNPVLEKALPVTAMHRDQLSFDHFRVDHVP